MPHHGVCWRVTALCTVSQYLAPWHGVFQGLFSLRHYTSRVPCFTLFFFSINTNLISRFRGTKNHSLFISYTPKSFSLSLLCFSLILAFPILSITSLNTPRSPYNTRSSVLKPRREQVELTEGLDQINSTLSLILYQFDLYFYWTY